MNPTESDALAKRIINCWRGGPALAQWVEVLSDLDAGQAGTTFVRLRKELEHAPSIARFHAEYRALETHDGSNRPAKCRTCDDTGWVETAQHEYRGGVYSGCEPCLNCEEGQARRTSTTWQKTGMRHFVSDAEAARLIAAEQRRHNPPKESAA